MFFSALSLRPPCWGQAHPQEESAVYLEWESTGACEDAETMSTANQIRVDVALAMAGLGFRRSCLQKVDTAPIRSRKLLKMALTRQGKEAL